MNLQDTQKQNKYNINTFEEIIENKSCNQHSSNHQVQCGIKQFKGVTNSSLITICGIPGIGKTFFSIYLMHEIAKYQPNKQVLFFSLEMTSNQIAIRYENLMSHQYDKMVYGKILDKPMLSIEDIEAISINEASKKTNISDCCRLSFCCYQQS